MLIQELLPSLAPDVFARLDAYAEHVLATNKWVNLTAITDPTDFTVKHIADSLTLLPVLQNCHGNTLLDVGTGAGFPGMVLAIAAPDWQVTLLDSTLKKVKFLRDAVKLLGINAQVLWERAEELSRTDHMFYTQYDVVTVRAVSAMPKLCRWCLPLLKSGGRLLAMKGQTVEPCEAELAQYGGRIIDTLELNLEGMERKIIVIEKC